MFDKRTLLFFLAFTLSLFAVNAFFAYYDKEKNKEWYEQQTIKKNQKIEKLKAEITKQTATLADFSLMEIYPDANSSEIVAYGVMIDKNLLTFGWSNEMPKTVFGKKVGSKQTSQSFQVISTAEHGELILYSSEKPASLREKPLPEIGRYDLQIVFLPSTTNQTPNVLWGRI